MKPIEYAIVTKAPESEGRYRGIYVVGTVHPRGTLEQVGIEHIVIDGSDYDPEEHPELARVLEALHYAPGKLPSFAGTTVRKRGIEDRYE